MSNLSGDAKDRLIDQIRDLYRLEREYTKRLESQIHREREVVEIAGFWHRSRGMHRAPWLQRLKQAVAKLESPEADRRGTEP